MKKLIVLFLLQGFMVDTFAQNFLNGSFEINSVTNCLLNTISNAGFDSVMTNVKGIGQSETIDIFYDTDCPGYGYAKQGHYYVSVENNFSDTLLTTAISLKLADTLQAGTHYSFCYYDRGIVSIGEGPLEIGVSNTDSTFGTLIYTSPLVDTVWTRRTVSFISPVTGRYITVKYGAFSGGAIVDNFGLCNGDGIDDNLFSENKYSISPNPATEEVNIKLLQTNSYLKSVRILNEVGQEVLLIKDAYKINISSLYSGLYFIEITTNTGLFFTKFVKE